MFQLFSRLAIGFGIILAVATLAHAASRIIIPAANASHVVEVAVKKSDYQGDVYLIRGFAGVFSRGLDQMGASLNAKGIKAKVIGNLGWELAASTIIRNQRTYGTAPVVLIGHSWGANAILRIAKSLQKRNIKVDYFVTFEANVDLPVPSNVKRAVNYYLSNSLLGLKLKQEPGSKGSFENIDLISIPGIGHFSIEKQAEIQKTVVENVARYFQVRGPNR